MPNKDDIIKGFAEQLKQSEDTRNDVLKMLALKDAKIDQIDEIISNIDRAIPQFLKNINDTVPAIKTAYDNRIGEGCRSALTWEETAGEEDDDGNTSTVFKVVPNDTGQQTNFYGQKYYQKPSNRDYGANVITEIKGNVKKATGTGISTISVISNNGIENIKIGDLVTDNLETPVIYPAGNLPRVTGFGSTAVLGITTTIQGNIGLGSDFFVAIGVGNTLAVEVGFGVSMNTVLPEGTTVIGIGTAVASLFVFNTTGPNAGTFQPVQFTRTAFQLSNVAATGSNLALMDVGPINTEPTLILDGEAQTDVEEQPFIIIRDTEDIDSDFDYLKSPLDPVVVGLLGAQFGIGHKSKIVNNGHPPGPETWREVLEEDEPKIGAGHVAYFVGNTSWPIVDDGEGNMTYATLSTPDVVSFGSTSDVNNAARFTSTSPSGLVDGVGACVPLDNAITNAENTFAAAVAANLPEARRLNRLSQALRLYREEEEIQAWGMLQGSAYEKQRAEKQKINTSNFNDEDLLEFY